MTLGVLGLAFVALAVWLTVMGVALHAFVSTVLVRAIGG